MALVLCVCPPDEMWVTSLSGRRKVLIFSGTVPSQLDRSHTACLEVLPACLPRPSVGKKCTKHAPGCDVCVPFEGQSNGGLIIPPIGHVTPVPVSQTVRSVVDGGRRPGLVGECGLSFCGFKIRRAYAPDDDDDAVTSCGRLGREWGCPQICLRVQLDAYNIIFPVLATSILSR